MPAVRVTTGSRLHFGLLSLSADAPRRFGGVGLMVDLPELVVTATSAPRWSFDGPLKERAAMFAARVLEGATTGPARVVVERAPPEHVGLGAGTQLALAVARAISSADFAAGELARRVDRGLRSALGVHGFERGGFLVDGGKRTADLAPLVSRADFPEAWRIVLARPAVPLGRHGDEERRAFADLSRGSPGTTDALCRLVLLGLLPALGELDVAAFGEALYEFNRRVGELFAPVQGGLYAGTEVAELVSWFRDRGVPGVGQSSWGPTVFAVVGDAARAEHLAAELRKDHGAEGVDVIVTAARNRGAEVSVLP
jgi:beta-RFAP synthase